MYPVVHLIHVCRNEKGPLDFLSERIKLNLPGTASKKKLKPHFIGRIIPS